MSDAQQAAEPAGTRFPFINLEKAIARAKALYDAAGDHDMTAGDVFETWGYSPKSSGGFQTVAALKSYGLIRAARNGDTSKLSLTSNAVNYFRDERPEMKLDLAKGFALEPQLIKALWARWGFTPPADHISRSHLKIDRALSDQSARSLLNIYKENIDFAKLKGDNKPFGTGEAPDSAQGGGPSDGPMPTPDKPPPKPTHHRAELHPMEGERVLSDGILSKEANYRVIVSGPIGVREIERLIKKLELDKEILADDDATDTEGAA